MQLKERIGCRLKLQDINVLVTVVEMGSMGKAAATLNTAQPAISRSIAELERALGVRLLERNRQGVRPTEYGRAFLNGATAVFDDLRQSVKNIAFLADPSVGEVRIGCNPTLAASFVAMVIDRLSRRYTRATFRVVTAYPDRMHRELAERNVDFLIARRFGPVADEHLHYEHLFDDPYVVLAGAKNGWVGKKMVRLADLVDEPWALPSSDTTAGSLALEAFEKCKLPRPLTAVSVEPAEARLNLVSRGRLLSIFPESVLKFSGKRFDIKVLPVKPTLSSVPVGIVTVKGRILSPLPTLFIESARKLATEMANDR